MLDLLQSSRINTDASEDDLKPGDYRDALNISLIANELGAFSKGTTYGNIDTNIKLLGLQPDAVCLGTAIDTAGTRAIITFYQRIAVPFTDEYQAVINYALSRGFQVPSVQVQVAQNYLIALLKQDGIWIGLDVFYCFFGDGDEDFAKINWKLPNDATIAVNHGLVYGVNYGYKGTGAAWLDTRWIPSTAVKFTLNNASFTIGYEEIFVDPAAVDGVFDTPFEARVTPGNAADGIFASINANGGFGIANAQISNNEGLIFVSRSAANAVAIRKNVSDSFPSAVVSNGRPTRPFSIGALNNNGVLGSFTLNRYSLFAAGENLNTFDREIKFYKNWKAYKDSFVSTIVEQSYVQEVLMYMLTDQIAGSYAPLIKSSRLLVTERSYLDGYSFVNELFFFNFRDSAPKVINIQRALDSPGFYDNLSETSLTVIKPHPPFSPVPVRAIGSLVNAPIQKKPFQFMMIYRFVDGEQSTKSPASEYLNSLDDREATAAFYDHINVTMRFPLKDYSIVKEIELFVRNNNAIADWRSVNVFDRTKFVQAGENYQYTEPFFDNVVGNFYPVELGIKINDAIPQRSNYLAFIENRIFMIDSLIDYDFTSTFQIKIDLDVNAPTPDDRLPVGGGPLYGIAEFEYDSEHSVGLAFYDRYGRKYPSSINDKKLVTPPFAVVVLPALDDLPDQTTYAQLRKAKITAKYDLRAAGNIANYGKPPGFAFWWGMIRSKNTKWEFQQSIQCLLRFPYSITKWPDTDPEKFPDPNLFLEDGYLYWHPEKLLYGMSGGGLDLTQTLINDYIDVVIPPNFPYALDNTIMIDFMMQVCTDVNANKIQIINREVVEIFANKIRIRGDRAARWFSNQGSGLGQYKAFPRFTTGVALTGVAPLGSVLTKDETTFPLIIKRRRQNNLESIILYDTPQVYPVTNPGTRFCSFQPTQTATIQRAQYPPLFIAPQLARTLNQGDILIQPILLTPTTVAFNHAIKITWGPNAGDSLRLKIKVSLWQLNDLNQPILELYSATSDAGGEYYVKNNETAEYLINADAELTNGWYGYGIQILEATASNVQFENPEFDLQLAGWLQSAEGLPALAWQWASTSGNFAFTNVSALGGGFSRTLYQYLHRVTKNDLTIEVTVEGVGLLGPVANSPLSQYPGNANVPLTNNANETLIDLGRNVVPYFIDCTTIVRKVTLNTLSYDLTAAAPAGTLVRAEIWLIDQITKRPVSMVGGSEGAWTAIGGLGVHAIPFGATKLIDTTGWYGIALAFDSPIFSDFADKNYVSGGANWIVTAGTPPWVFAPDAASPPVYQDVVINPVTGANQGFFPMDSDYNLSAPLFLPTGSDPAGYDTHRIIIEWGDNAANGWFGAPVTVAIWEVDQGTKKPLTALPLMSSVTDVRSVTSEHFISNAQKLLGNKWYQFGIRVPSGHTAPTQPQFLNNSFIGGTTNWSIIAGTGASIWTYSADTVYANVAIGTFNTGIIQQTMNGIVQVSIPRIDIGNGMTGITAELIVNGVLKESIVLTGTQQWGLYTSVSFQAVKVTNQTVGVRFTGTASVAYGIIMHGIFNAFDPYAFSTPMLRKYALSNADYESWINYGSPVPPRVLPQDYAWSEGLRYWKHSLHQQTSPSVWVIADAAAPALKDTAMALAPGSGGWSSVSIGAYPWDFLGPHWESALGNSTPATDYLRSPNIVFIPKGKRVKVSVGAWAPSGKPTTFKVRIPGLPDTNATWNPAGGVQYDIYITATKDFCDYLRIQLVASGGTFFGNVEIHGATLPDTPYGEVFINLAPNTNDNPTDPYMRSSTGWSYVLPGFGWGYDAVAFKWNSTANLTKSTAQFTSPNTINLVAGVTKLRITYDLKNVDSMNSIEVFATGFTSVIVTPITNGSAKVVVLTANATIATQVKVNFFVDVGTSFDISIRQAIIEKAAVITDLIYSRINMNDAITTAAILNMALRMVGGGSGTIEGWVFNDPANFTAAGIKIVNQNVASPFVPGQPDLDFTLTDSVVNLPAGYKFFGWRVTNYIGPIGFNFLRGEFVITGAAFNSWYKDVRTLGVSAKERQLANVGGTILANFHVDNVAVGVTTARLGQNNLTGTLVRANIELFAGLALNSYDLILYDSNGFELGRTAVVGQALAPANPQISINAVNAPTTTGLYLAVQNKNPAVPQVSDPEMTTPAGWINSGVGNAWVFSEANTYWSSFNAPAPGSPVTAYLTSANSLNLPVGTIVKVTFFKSEPSGLWSNVGDTRIFLRSGTGGIEVANLLVTDYAYDAWHTVDLVLHTALNNPITIEISSDGADSYHLDVYVGALSVFQGLISARIRQITNVNAAVTIAADNGVANAKTWQVDNVNNMVQLATTSVTFVGAVQDLPQPAEDITIVLADASGAEISAQQVFTPNTGEKILVFAPTLALDGNYNYGVKVKNNPLNSQLAGTIRIHSVLNVATNDGFANIIANTIDPVNPLYEAWNQFSLGAFARSGYVSNFIAVVDDLIMSAFTPIQINPTSYHLVANIVPPGVPGHSGNYGNPPNSTYNYGIVYPSASSDPDAAGIVYTDKTGQSIGDINIKITDMGEKSQSNIVRWSDPVIVGTRTNNLNAFSDFNKYAVDFQRGAIQVMIAMHDHTLFCVHTQGMSSLYVQRATMISPGEVEQGDQLFLTNKVVGSDNKLTSNLGTINPESVRVVESGTIAYGFDLIRKSFWQKTNNGVRNLTYECNAKTFFNQVCFYRLKAYNEGEDVKIYTGYNEKQKSFYITFAPFVYRGQPYPAVTIAYNSYIDGFLSRYSFEPISYLATEDTLHTIKARELLNPDFFGDFSVWKTDDSTGTANWSKELQYPGRAYADTSVPGGTRILNPDFSQGPTFWSLYGAGSAWEFVNDGAESVIPAAGFSQDLVNTSGAPATFLLRISAKLPVAGLNYSIKVYNNVGAVLEVLVPDTPMTGDDIIQVTQTQVGRIGLILHNTSGAPITAHLNLFTTVAKTYLLYQALPTVVEDLRVRLVIPERLGSIHLYVYAFNDPNAPAMTLLQEVNLIGNKSEFTLNINVPNGTLAKYVGLYAITDYAPTLIKYFNVNSVASIWVHDQAGKTNNFFGVQYDSAIELVFNVQAGQVRIFNSLGIMSETAWSVESFTTSEKQLSALDTANFRLRDGIYTATIMRDMLTPQDALPDPVNNIPIMHGSELVGVWIKMVLRNSETLRQIELRAVYLGSDELSGNLLGKK